MPLTWDDAPEIVPPLMALVKKIQAGVSAIPKPTAPAPAGGEPIKPYFDLAGSCLPEVGALVDLIRRKSAD